MRVWSASVVLLFACQGSPASPPAAPRAPAPLAAQAQPASARRPSSTVTFHLHKLLLEIGAEIDTYTPGLDGGLEAKATFSFRDRATTVPLTSMYELDASGALLRYASFGRTSRFTEIDDRVDAMGDGAFRVARLGKAVSSARPSGPFAAVSAYAPALGQSMLLDAWSKAGRPARVSLLPDGAVTIAPRGKETYADESGKKIVLEHLAIGGLVWGREDAWIDEQGKLAAIVTRDAEFDHFEIARDGFVTLLPELAKAAGTDGVAWLAGAGKEAERGGDGKVAIVGAQLVDGTGGPPIKDAVVVYEGATILAAGPRASTPIPPGATTIEAAGKSILPGLWDMHAHVEQVEQGAVYLAAGVTTVRDLGNLLEFIGGVRDAIDAGKGLGPRVLVDGLVDGEGDAAAGTVRIKKSEDVVPVLDRLKKAGCLEVKIYSSVAPRLVPEIAREAHKRGLRVTGHVPSDMDAQQALDAGYDAIDHVSYLVLDGLTTDQKRALSREERLRRLAAFDLKSPRMDALFRTFKSKGAYLDDTLALYDLLFHTEAEDAKNEPGIAKLPPEVRAMIGAVDPPHAEAAAGAFDKYLEIVSELHKRGVPVVAGTDIAVPGHSLHRELELYVRAGFTPIEALQAATSIPAKLMHLDKEVGTIAKGKRADLVLVDGDPTHDIRDVRKIVTVVARGRAYDPAALWKLAGFAP